METTSLSIAAATSTFLFSLLPRGIHSNRSGSYTGLTEAPDVFIVRADNGQPSTIVNVFSEGKKAYAFERNSYGSKQWALYELPERRHVAVITIGLFNRSVDFVDKPGIQHRELKGLLQRIFYLTDGASYRWTRISQNLERIINPGQGHEELHERIGRVRLLRRFRFEWEVLVDPKFDAEVALATAFVAMNTQWPLYSATTPGIPTRAGASRRATEQLVYPHDKTLGGAEDPAEAAPAEANEAKIGTADEALCSSQTLDGQETPDSLQTKNASLFQPGENVADIPAHLLVYQAPPSADGEFFAPPEFLRPKLK